MRASKYTRKVGAVILHPSKGTHWITYINEHYFDSYGCCPSLRISQFIKKNFESVFFLKIKSKEKTVTVLPIVCIFFIWMKNKNYM